MRNGLLFLRVLCGAVALVLSVLCYADTSEAEAADKATPELLEQGLQALSWPQFQAVVTAIPKLNADIEAYGAFGWQYVRANYQHYEWRKNISKLEPEQKRHLADLIRDAQSKH